MIRRIALMVTLVVAVLAPATSAGAATRHCGVRILNHPAPVACSAHPAPQDWWWHHAYTWRLPQIPRTAR